MATRKYDLAVKTGSYQNQNGETKNRYMNVGVVLEGDNGPFILLDPAFNPAGVPRKDDRVLISMFEPSNHGTPRDTADDYQNASKGGEPAGGMDDEIPF